MLKSLNKTVRLTLLLVTVFSIRATAQPKHLAYFDKRNLAELAICDSNFEEADKYYKEAFAINSTKPFSKDLLNAFFSAMDTKQYGTADKYLAQLMSRGLGGVFIHDHILKYYTGEQLQKISSMLKNHPNDTSRKRPLASKINEMVKWDQGVRDYYSEMNEGAYMVDSTYKVDSINAMALLKIFKAQGVPNEAMLGNSMYDDFSVDRPDYSIIVYHHNGGIFGDMPSHLLDTLLYKALLTLDIDAHNFAELLSHSPRSRSFGYKDVTIEFPFLLSGVYYKEQYYSEYFDDASEKKMNEQRQKLGLETLDEFRKKIEAGNTGRRGNSCLGKYTLSPRMGVMDVSDENSLSAWLKKKGKNAIVRKPVGALEIATSARLYYGVIGDRFVIGNTRYTDFIDEFKKMPPELNNGTIPYKNWPNRKPPLPWNYNAEVVSDSSTDLSIEGNRYDRARFVPGFNMLVSEGYTYWGIGTFRNIELLFNDGKLMTFVASIDSTFYKTVSRKIGPPTTVSITRDTVTNPLRQEKTVLKKKDYIWRKENLMMQHTITEKINKKGDKYVSSIFTMMDEKKYEAYLKQVDLEKRKLDLRYAKKESQ